MKNITLSRDTLLNWIRELLGKKNDGLLATLYNDLAEDSLSDYKRVEAIGNGQFKTVK